MDRQYVGIDFHRRRSVIVHMSAMGERLAVTRVPNEPLAISAAMKDAGVPHRPPERTTPNTRAGHKGSWSRTRMQGRVATLASQLRHVVVDCK